MSLKKTFKTPSVIPSPIAKAICNINSGMQAKKTQPGKLPVMIKKTINKEKMIPKLSAALRITITGRQIRGKLSFLSKLALSIKTDCALVLISETSDQVMMPIQS